MFPKPAGVAAAIVAELPDLPPLVSQAASAAFFIGQAADRVGQAAARVPDLEPIADDVQDTLSAWKTAGHAVTVTCAVVGIVAVIGLLMLSAWKPEEFR